MKIFFMLLGLGLVAAAIGFGRAAWGVEGFNWWIALPGAVCLIVGVLLLITVWQMQTGRVSFKQGCKEVAQLLLSIIGLS